MTDYKIALKVDGKWLNVGNFKKNQWGNMSLGLKLTPELAKLLLETETGKWVNLSAFPDDGNKRDPVLSTEAVTTVLNDEIPF